MNKLKTNDELLKLIELAKSMNKYDDMEQRISFIYGNLNGKYTMEHIRRVITNDTKK